jgi:ABC-type enterochelin transport system ATPase subunit
MHIRLRFGRRNVSSLIRVNGPGKSCVLTIQRAFIVLDVHAGDETTRDVPFSLPTSLR